ncbi:MAG TPA: pitrilysin family protein [Actinomycetota bacterium]
MDYQRTDLDCGIRILTEHVPGVRSASLGAWVGAGSRDEPPELNGATHFLEHLLFKGTPTRTAQQIAELFDAVGGDLNAFTAKEYTCFHSRTLDEDLPMAVEVIADMVEHSLLNDADVESERQVVLEEIGMHDDAPDDIVFDLFNETIWGDHPLGRRIQGRADTVAAMSREQVHAYYRLHYRPGNLVFAAAGNVRHDDVVDAVGKAYAHAPAGPTRVARTGDTAPPLHNRIHVEQRKLEQSHVVYGTGGLSRNDPDRFALGVLNIVLGGGMSSRLFQEIREKRGLVYSVWSSHTGYAETGLFTIYAAAAAKRVREVLSLVRDEIARVVEDGITGEELARGKGHLTGSLVLGLEDTGSRMSRLGKGELCHNEILSPDEVVERVKAVTQDDVIAAGRRVLTQQPWALTVLGPGDGNGYDEFVT